MMSLEVKSKRCDVSEEWEQGDMYDADQMQMKVRLHEW